MSVNKIVARTRSGIGGVREPVRNSSISAATASLSPTNGRLSPSGSSTSLDPGMRPAA
jgi:hypothetical protein